MQTRRLFIPLSCWVVVIFHAIAGPTISSKSADANAARVESAMNDKLMYGEAVTQYTTFDLPRQGGGNLSTSNIGGKDGQVVHNPLFEEMMRLFRPPKAPRVLIFM